MGNIMNACVIIFFKDIYFKVSSFFFTGSADAIFTSTDD